MKNIVYILFLCSAINFAQGEAQFKNANDLYNKNQFTEAIKSYEAILKTGVHSAELYFNLGNAHYKLNNIGPSIYYYEKAKLLAPDDKDIANNLAFAQNMTIDNIEVLPQTDFSKFIDGIAAKLSYDGWAVAGIFFAVIFVLLFLVYYFAHNTLVKRGGFTISLLSLVLMIVSLLFASEQLSAEREYNPAIVFVEKASVRVGPKLSDEEAFVLHEGTKVQVLDAFDGWQKVKISDGSEGWLPDNEIKLLKDF